MQDQDLTREEWEAEYARLALASRFEFTAETAAQEAKDAWEEHDQERGDEAMTMPSDAIAEDMLEWMHR